MPLTLNVGLNRKVGEANFSSRGASVNFQVEVEPTLVCEPDELRGKIRYLFDLAKDAVEEELNGPSLPNSNSHDTNGRNENGNGQSTKARPATASQVRAIHAIADRHRIDLSSKLRKRFGIAEPAELSISEASQVIDELKTQHNGNGGRR